MVKYSSQNSIQLYIATIMNIAAHFVDILYKHNYNDVVSNL